MPQVKQDHSGILDFIIANTKEQKIKDVEIEEMLEEHDEIKSAEVIHDQVKINGDMSDKNERRHNWAITIFSVIGAVLLTAGVTILFAYKSPALSQAELNKEQIHSVESVVKETSRELGNLRTEIANDIRNIDGKVDRIYNLLLEIKQGE